MASRFTYDFSARAPRRSAVRGALILCISSLTGPVQGNESHRLACADPIHLTAALSVLGRRTGATITYDAGLLPAVRVCPIATGSNVAAALKHLLAGTGLLVKRTGARKYDLRRASAIHGPELPTQSPLGEGANNTTDTLIVHGARISPQITPANVTFNADDDDQAGFATVGESLSRATGQLSLPEFSWGDGALYADERGLGADFTTVLFNDNWLATTATSGVAFDLNALPLSFIARVEALDELQAAKRGLSALGGTIDVQLNEPSLPRAWLAIGGAAGGGMQRQVAASTKIDFEQWSVGVWVDYFQREALPGRARDLWRDQNYSAQGGSDYRSRASWPGNIRSTTGMPLPGLSSAVAAVPIDTTGRAPAIEDFLDTDGAYQLDSLRRFSSILPATQRRGVLLTMAGTALEITPFAEFIGVWRDCDARFTPPTLVDALVPTSNAHNPFGQPLYASRLLLEIEPRRVVTTAQWWRFAGGLRGEFGQWYWSTTVSRSEEFATRWANNALDEGRVANALASSDPATALNLFQSGPVGSPELMASLVSPPGVLDYRSFGTAVAANLHGPLSPESRIVASFDARWREERSVAKRAVTTLRAGLDIPLWSNALEAHLSTRWDRFSDIGADITSSYVLEWRPLPGLELHATHASQFREPSLPEMFGSRYEVETLVSDRRRGGAVGLVAIAGGSNDELSLVHGNSTSFGFSVIPNDLSELEVRGDYWLKRVDSRIVTPPLSLVMDHESRFPGRVVRNAPTAADLAAGLPGTLRSIDIATTHIGGIEASGIDASVSYRFSWGIDATLAATWMDEFSTLDMSGDARTTRLGVAHPRGTIPRWRGSLSIRWHGQLASAALHTRYIGSYNDMVANRYAGRRLQPQAFVDLQTSVSLAAVWPGVGLLDGVKFTVGALNVLDKSPQYSASGLDVGFDPSLSDPRQRFFFLRLEKQF